MYNRNLHRLFWFCNGSYESKAYAKGRANYGRIKARKPTRNARAYMLLKARIMSKRGKDWIVG